MVSPSPLTWIPRIKRNPRILTKEKETNFYSISGKIIYAKNVYNFPGVSELTIFEACLSLTI
jgi:hypothetical protein